MYYLTKEGGREGMKYEEREEWLEKGYRWSGEEGKMMEGGRWRVEGKMKGKWRKQRK